jgi:hypothetical protein
VSRRRELTAARLDEQLAETIATLRRAADFADFAAELYEAEAEEDRRRARRKDALAAEAHAVAERLLALVRELEALRNEDELPEGDR